jgi:hypothetical protein
VTPPAGAGAAWSRLSVDYCQYGVITVPGAPRLDIHTIGDSLVHVSGPGTLTGYCGTHSGWIEARLRVLPGPPAHADAGWHAISEATLWCPSGRLSVVGLLGGVAEALSDVAVPRGLLRVRVHARHRLHETARTDDDPPEQHELHVWAVSEETTWRTVLADPESRDWPQKPDRAAEWAMLSLVPRPANRPAGAPPLPLEPYEDDTGLPRVDVVRHRPAPVELPVGELPAGDLVLRLERVDDRTLTCSWAEADEPIFPRPLTTLPDDEPSIVRLTSGPDGFTLRHEGVRGRHAFALGLVWDHLLDQAGSYPWMAKLQAQAAEATARAEENRRRQAERDAERWGGPPPSERVRRAFGQAQSLAGRPLPRPFTEPGGTHALYRRLSDKDTTNDPATSNATLAWRLGPQETPAREIPVQITALAALIASAKDDPLIAAIDAVYCAADAHRDDRDRFLAEVHTFLG